MGMADANKRINLAAPLISVRRHGGEATYYKAGDTSGPMGHAGTVPFGWEHRPGHPKSVRTRRPPPTVAPKEAPTSPPRFSDDTVNCSAAGLSDAACAAAPGSAMMERFLPAAHAVAVASPLSTFRKAGSVVREPARAFDGDRLPMQQRRLPLQHIPANHLPQDKDDDDESDVHSTHGFASKRCGLLPTRCVKNTLLLLNPAPAVRRSRRGEGRSLVPSGSQRETNPLLRRSRSGQQQRHTGGGHDPDTQSWEELYIRSLLRSARGGLTAPAAAVASELDRTVRELYRRRGGKGGGGAVQPKASHLGLLLVLDRSNDACHGETALLLPRAKSSPHAEKKPSRGPAEDAGGYGFPLLLEDKAAASPSPQAMLPALPLPKSPSESWLSRALPSVSNRPPPATSFLGLRVPSRKHAPSPWCSIHPSAKAVVDHHARQRQNQMLLHHLQT